MIIEWYKNRQRKKRLFRDRIAYTRYINQLSIKDRDLFISWVSNIRRHMVAGNNKEVETRVKWLTQAGFQPPEDVIQCDIMLDDLRKFYV